MASLKLLYLKINKKKKKEAATMTTLTLWREHCSGNEALKTEPKKTFARKLKFPFIKSVLPKRFHFKGNSTGLPQVYKLE